MTRAKIKSGVLFFKKAKDTWVKTDILGSAVIDSNQKIHEGFDESEAAYQQIRAWKENQTI